MGDVAKGRNPAADRKDAAAAERVRRARNRLTLRVLIDDWNRLHLARRRRSYAAEAVRALTRWRDDFPTPGVRFADLTPVFADPDGFRMVADALCAAKEDGADLAGGGNVGAAAGVDIEIGVGSMVLIVRGSACGGVYCNSARGGAS